jgi:hypothetical protein
MMKLKDTYTDEGCRLTEDAYMIKNSPWLWSTWIPVSLLILVLLIEEFVLS